MQSVRITRKVKPVQRRKIRKPLSQEIESIFRLLKVTLCVLGLTAMLSFLYLSSLKPVKGYQLKQLQIDHERLQSEQRDLERQIIEAQSFSNIENQEELEPMEKIGGEDFTFVEDSAYAQAD